MSNYVGIDSSLNEMDLAVGEVLLKVMRKADNRPLTEGSETLLWSPSRVLQVDDLSTEEMFEAYQQANPVKTDVNITYPILGYKANTIDEVFYGTGNRVRQWNFENPLQGKEIEKGEEILITKGEHRGDEAYYQYDIDGKKCVVLLGSSEIEIAYTDFIRSEAASVNTFKAKQIQTTYDVGILVEFRKEARYLMDKFILRCADGEIWHKYTSKVAGDVEFHIFTVFGIPNVDRYPTSDDKLKGAGYIYGITFQIQVWGWLADGPLPQNFINQVKLNIDYAGFNTKPNKITITA